MQLLPSNRKLDPFVVMSKAKKGKVQADSAGWDVGLVNEIVDNVSISIVYS